MRDYQKQPFDYMSQFFRPSAHESKPSFGSLNTISDGYSRVGPYKYKESSLIGKGFSSQVYKGYHQDDPTKPYAIKAINLKKFKASSLKLLENEIQIHQHLSHPNVVKCHHTYKTRQFYYIVTEFCEGGDLASIIKRNKKVEGHLAAKIINDVIAGYKYLIDQNILHRDLKPANIFNAGGCWKIGDFGFATKTNQITQKFNVGTPLYMPPQALQLNKYSHRSDIFAIGIMAYELVSGVTPWGCKNEKQLIDRMNTIPIKYPPLASESQLLKFMKKACEIDQRYRLSPSELAFISPQDHGDNPEHRPSEKLVKIKSASNLPRNKERMLSFDRHSPKLKNVKSKPSLPFASHLKCLFPNKFFECSTEVSDNDSNLKVEELYKQNNRRLISELQVCRLTFYMIKNIDCFLIRESHERRLFFLLLFKFIVRLVQEISDPRFNNLGLKVWDMYKVSQEYLQLQREIKLYHQKFMKEYNQFCRIVELEEVKIINREYPQLSTHTIPLNAHFYSKCLKLIGHKLRNLNHETMKVLKQNQGNLAMVSHHIQALSSLFSFYWLMMDKSVGKEPNIRWKIVIDYQRNQITSEQFQELRKKIKTL